MRVVIHDHCDGHQAITGVVKMASLHGLDVVIETQRGTYRNGPWGKALLMADYGYIRRVPGADGDDLDCFIGHDYASPAVWVIDQIDPFTRQFDEHKVMLGFSSMTEAVAAYTGSYNDGLGFDRIDRVRLFRMNEFKAWMTKLRLSHEQNT